MLPGARPVLYEVGSLRHLLASAAESVYLRALEKVSTKRELFNSRVLLTLRIARLKFA